MNIRRLLAVFALFFASLTQTALASSDAGTQPTSATIPPGVTKMLAHMSKSWADRNLDEVMTVIHPNFKSIGRDKAAQRKFYQEQLFPNIRRWDLSLDSFRQEGNIAHVMLKIHTERGVIPFPTQLILDSDRWYFYGNRE